MDEAQLEEYLDHLEGGNREANDVHGLQKKDALTLANEATKRRDIPAVAVPEEDETWTVQSGPSVERLWRHKGG